MLVLTFITHITFIGYNIKYPDIPSVRVFSEDLRNIKDFPLSFKLCAEEETNMEERYRKFGYQNIQAFYQGRQKMEHGNWFGWAGHGNGNETLGTVLGKINSSVQKLPSWQIRVSSVLVLTHIQ